MTIITTQPLVTAVPASASSIGVMQTQYDPDGSSDSSPPDDASSITPCVDSALQERHLQPTNHLFEAVQSRCSKLVAGFLRRKMKVDIRASGDASAVIQMPTDTRIDVAVAAAAAAGLFSSLLCHRSPLQWSHSYCCVSPFAVSLIILVTLLCYCSPLPWSHSDCCVAVDMPI